MKRSLGLSILWLMLMVATPGCETGAPEPIKEKETTPTIAERLTKDVVKGTLLTVHGEYYVIQNTEGVQVRVHVDQSTKLDQVVEGDMVRAYVADQGHATTLQRVEKER